MNWENIETLSLEDRQMLLSFGRLDPPLGRFPHCLFPATQHNLRIVLNVVGEIGGVWGVAPLWDANDQCFIEPEDGRILQDFALWAAPQNQAWLLDRGFFGDAFHMVIPSRTSAETLEDLYAIATPSDGEYRYYTCINTVAKLMNRLKWCYIPLEYEYAYALFVAAPEHKHWVDQVTTTLRNNEEEVIHLAPDGERFRWTPLRSQPW